MSVIGDNLFLDLVITSTISSFSTQKRFRKDNSIRQLKDNLELLTGILSSGMRLELYDKHDKLIDSLTNDDTTLGSYNVHNGMRLHVLGKGNERVGEFEDLSQVEKYTMSDEDYAARTESVRAFKEKLKLGRFKEIDKEEQAKKDEEERIKLESEKEAAASIAVGNRCEVHVVNQPTRRGTVMFVGLTDFKPGYWIGVKYDEPVGKNDGSVGGKRYFDCLPKYGGFVKAQDITVGDFPELDDELDEL